MTGGATEQASAPLARRGMKEKTEKKPSEELTAPTLKRCCDTGPSPLLWA